MKPQFNRISHSLLIGSSIIASNVAPVLADDALNEQKIAMAKPTSALSSRFSSPKLSAEKLLAMADSINHEQKNLAQEELEFALIFSAAKKGLAEAQFRLANYYMDSELIAPDETEAAYWFEEAIAQGHKDAKFVYENIFILSFDIGC